MASDKTKLELLITALVGAFGIGELWKTQMQGLLQKTIVPMLAPVVEDKREELLREIDKLNAIDQKRLMDRLVNPRAPWSQARLVVLLAKFKPDPQTGRREILTHLAQMEDDPFYDRMNVLHHDAFWEIMRKEEGELKNDLKNLKRIVGSAAVGASQAAKEFTGFFSDRAREWAESRKRESYE
jgi:hypothetical protein